VRWLGLPVALLLVVTAALLFGSSGRPSSQPAFTLSLDPGTPLSGQTPDFTLVDQFGARVSLHSFRGRVVMLAFNAAECTTICPLTTTAMVAAQRLLGPVASRVALLGVDANPTATSIGDVRTYSELHGMVHAWHFLTDGLPELKRVWTDYHVAVAIEHGQVDHTPALFMITPAGRFDKVYLTQMSYASVDQQAQLLAREASSLLPGHPAVHSRLSYAQIPVIYPRAAVALARAGGGSVRLGPGSPRLLVFFATWDTEVTDLATRLDLLGRYDAAAAARGLPRLVAVDEASVEPSPAALPRFLGTLTRLRSTPRAGSPTATECRTSPGSCSSPPRAGFSGTTTSRRRAGLQLAHCSRRCEPR
jgi:cytochrome oxidase Cu insertion factor (SCO1/SenC/PrrC family)